MTKEEPYALVYSFLAMRCQEPVLAAHWYTKSCRQQKVFGYTQQIWISSGKLTSWLSRETSLQTLWIQLVRLCLYISQAISAKTHTFPHTLSTPAPMMSLLALASLLQLCIGTNQIYPVLTSHTSFTTKTLQSSTHLSSISIPLQESSQSRQAALPKQGSITSMRLGPWPHSPQHYLSLSQSLTNAQVLLSHQLQ